MTAKILEYFRLLRTIRANLGNKIKLLHCAAGSLVKAFSISKAQIGAIVLQLRNKLSLHRRLPHCESIDPHAKQMTPRKLCNSRWFIVVPSIAARRLLQQ
jgi:hypothetical protein